MTLSAAYLFSPQAAHSSYPITAVRFSCLEVTGNDVRDVLTDQQVSLMDDAAGVTQYVGAVSRHVSSCDELQEVIEACLASRQTRSTSVHDSSSRSHLIIQLTFNYCGEGVASRGGGGGGSITFTDLAGSEWARDQVPFTPVTTLVTTLLSTSMFSSLYVAFY